MIRFRHTLNRIAYSMQHGILRDVIDGIAIVAFLTMALAYGWYFTAF